FTSGLTGCCVFEKGQAHRADLTTSRIEDGSREPEMKKARRSEPKTQKAPAFAEALNFFFNGEHTMPIVRTN
ncbi:hypothetical protein ACYBSG_23555, partial [Klebsiella pneumoniae]